MRQWRSLMGMAAVVALVAGLTMTSGSAGALDGGTTCRTYGTDGVQSVEVEIGDGDTRTTFQYRNGRVLVDGTDCGRIIGRGILVVLDGGEFSTNTLVFDASTRWSTGGVFTIPVTLNLASHAHDGPADRVILRGSGQRDLVDVGGSTLSMRRGGQVVFSTVIRRGTLPVVELRGGNDRFRVLNSRANEPIEQIIVKGGPGNDVMIGDVYAERFIGGGGNDRLVGKGGSDVLNGGKGRDRLVPGGGADVVNGGPGTDTCVCRAADTVTNVP